jgi:FMN phosphatase YigB (HAD superfamily)
MKVEKGVHTPKAVVFDLGNVLLNFDYRRAVERVKSRCVLSEAELHRLIAESEHFLKFEGGEINGADFFAAVQKESCFTGNMSEFAEIFGDVFTEVPEMIAFHERLRAKKIPTYILSNTNEFSIRFIEKRYPFFGTFTDYIYSFEHKVMKPAARIYDIVEERAGHRGANLFYIDDREENVEAAAARGWQVSWHTNVQKTLDLAANLGL